MSKVPPYRAVQRVSLALIALLPMACSQVLGIEPVESNVCGDGHARNGEVCDRTDLAGETCAMQGWGGGGTLACNPGCDAFITADCLNTCGDQHARNGEVCDGMDLAGQTCATQGWGGGGTLGCNLQCGAFVTSNCVNACGDNQARAGEVCDGADIGAQTCVTRGFAMGMLGCNANCGDYDTSACSCLTGQTYCAAAMSCVDMASDELHCGGCSTSCAVVEACSAGACRLPAVYAVRPAIVRPGETLTLEGVFGDGGGTITFAGGATVALQLLGADRATAVVPAAASSGPAQVTTLGQAITTPRVRVATYGLGLQLFERIYNQGDVAQTTPTLVTARSGAAVMRTDRWLYVLGGTDSSGTVLASIERARINDNGTLGPFKLAGNLAAARTNAAVINVGSRVYVIGGRNGAGPLATVEAATIASDVLGAFTTVPIGLGAARADHTAVVLGRWVYVIGGGASIDRAAIQADGTLGAFAPTAIGLTTPRIAPAVAVAGGHVYVVGGSAAGSLPSIERATVDGDGTIRAFSALPVSLTSPRTGAMVTAHGGRLYVLGGANASALATTEQATINADGSLNAFAASATLSTARHGAAATIIGNWLYAIGGKDSTGAVISTVERGSLIGSVSLGAFAQASATGSARKNRGSIVIGNSVFNIFRGQSDPANEVERAPLSSAGVLGDFATAPSVSFAPARNQPGVAVISDYLYAFGGTYNPGSCCLVATSYVRSPISASGELGAFVSPDNMQIAREGATMVVIPPYVYAIAGSSTAGSLASIERAVINADGTLGSFGTVSASLNDARGGAGSIIIGPYLYVIGGENVTPILGVERSTIQANGDLGAFQRLTTNLPVTGRYYPGLLLLGNRLFLMGGYGNTGGNGLPVTSVEVATVNADGTLGAFATVPGLSVTNGAGAIHAAVENSLYLITPTLKSVLGP